MRQSEENVDKRFFLSHNSFDKEFVRRLASILSLAGSQIWFDEWTISPGDSIPTAISDGINDFGTFVLIWSANASKSRWVGSELDAAIFQRIGKPERMIVPIVLDDTPLPNLVQPIKHVDGQDLDFARIGRELLGLNNEFEYRIAVQETIEIAGIEIMSVPHIGSFIGCPKCGASPEGLKVHTGTYQYGEYIAVRCSECGWEDGSDI